MTHTKIYCIKDLYYSNGCVFIKNNIYNISIDNNYYKKVKRSKEYKDISRISIYDDAGNNLDFDITSLFHVNTYPKHFVDISKLRKEKLDKLNSL